MSRKCLPPFFPQIFLSVVSPSTDFVGRPAWSNLQWLCALLSLQEFFLCPPISVNSLSKLQQLELHTILLCSCTRRLQNIKAYLVLLWIQNLNSAWSELHFLIYRWPRFILRLNDFYSASLRSAVCSPTYDLHLLFGKCSVATSKVKFYSTQNVSLSFFLVLSIIIHSRHIKPINYLSVPTTSES